MHKLNFDRYLRFDELTRTLQDWAAARPDLLRLSSIGKSYSGRDIWLATLTRFATGSDLDKPAIWIDGNIHSAELIASMAALRLIQDLLEKDGQDAEISRCLDSRVFYICPRVNPDGAEWALADIPKLVRSSIRPWPWIDTPTDGLEIQDMDGDGRILTMRIADSNGPWKVSSREPRLLVQRDPAETGGQYYRLLTEGRFRNFDAMTLPVHKVQEGLDLNRNFPARWRGEHEQYGAGPFPGSEPEVRAIIDFIGSHGNICSGVALHSYSGLLLRPFSYVPDEDMPAEDRWTYTRIGAKGEQLTGYPAVAAYHDFRYHPQETSTGAMDDWMYEELGRFAWTVEFWSPHRQAGIDNTRYIDWYREHDHEDDIKLLAWSDNALHGKAYIDWYPYDHPQLGAVELGGWNPLFSFWNPPPEALAEEISGIPKWLIWHNLISPCLAWRETRVEQLQQDLWRIQTVVENTGWLPTDITRLARDKKMLRGVVLELVSDDALVMTATGGRVQCAQLEGRNLKASSPNVWGGRPSDPTEDRCTAEWIVKASPGAKIFLHAHHERAGRIKQELVLTPAAAAPDGKQ